MNSQSQNNGIKLVQKAISMTSKMFNQFYSVKLNIRPKKKEKK